MGVVVVVDVRVMFRAWVDFCVWWSLSGLADSALRRNAGSKVCKFLVS